MTAAGIVAEYNPFHGGHAHHIAGTRRLLGPDTAMICVMSGNWVQRGDCAVFDKWTRARAALEGGADLVLELPTVWALSSAEGFARGATDVLEASGVVSHLSFGSECGNVDWLQRVAACLDGPAYRAALLRFLGEGLPFAACRQRAAGELLCSEAIMCRHNALKSRIQPITILREGADHDGGDHPDFPSASFLRERLRNRGGENTASLAHCERAILAKLRVMRLADWAKLPDSGEAEGLPRRLERAGRECTRLEEFYALAQTKRYAHARLRRLVLWAFLGLTAEDVPDAPPYLRVLGLNSRGRELLREMKSRAAVPVLTKPAHIERLEESARRLFALEERCTDLYGLCFETPRPSGWEKRASAAVMQA